MINNQTVDNQELRAEMDIVDDAELGARFRSAMRSVASAVYLVTGRGPAGDAGMTATAACSLSFDPHSMLVCVNRSASMLGTIEASGRFVLNLLSAEDEAIAAAFGGAADRDSRFARGDWYDLEGMPALRSSLASIACDVAETMDFGTHRIFAGRVVAVDLRPAAPGLLYSHGQFRTLD